MLIDLKAIFYAHPTQPLSREEFKKGMLTILFLTFIGFFFYPLFILVGPLMCLITSRRLSDLLGEEFYQGTRSLLVFLLMAGVFSIPFAGLPLSLWILAMWDRARVREFLRDFFEAAEMI